MHGPLSQHTRGVGSADQRAGAPAANVPEILREIPRPHSIWDRCRSQWNRHATTGLQRRVVRYLLPLSGDRGRILRLRPRASTSPGAVADLWAGLAGRDTKKGLLRKCCAVAAFAPIALRLHALSVCTPTVNDKEIDKASYI